MKKLLLIFAALAALATGSLPAQVTRGQFNTSVLLFAPSGLPYTNFYWLATNYYNADLNASIRTNSVTHRWEYLVGATLIATNSTATNVWHGTNGVFAATSYWPATGYTPGTNTPVVSTNQTAGGIANPPVTGAPLVIYAGTNSPEGVYAAARGSMYNQFDASTNFLAQWIKQTAALNSSGWMRINSSPPVGLTNNFPGNVNFNSITLGSQVCSMNFFGDNGVFGAYLQMPNGHGGLDVANSKGRMIVDGTASAESLTATGGTITNSGLVWYAVRTNGVPNVAAANGSICTTTNGAFFVRTNATWILK